MFNRPKPKETILQEILEAVQRVERRQNIEFAELQVEFVRVNSELSRQQNLLEQVLADLGPEAESLQATISIDGGQSMAGSATFTLGVNTAAVETSQEFDGPGGTGNPLPPAGTIGFASDNASVATVDPSSGSITVVAAGLANISATDSVNGLSDSVALTVQNQAPPPAQSLVATISVT